MQIWYLLHDVPYEYIFSACFMPTKIFKPWFKSGVQSHFAETHFAESQIDEFHFVES